MLLVNKRIRILENKVKFVTRDLPGKAKILVAAGQQVSPQDVLAKGIVNMGFRSINLAKLLEVSPKSVKKYLSVDFGEKIFKDELLAFKPSSFLRSQKLVISPTDGVLHSVNEKTGEARLAFLPQEIFVPAAFYVFVEKIDPLRGKIWIKTCVTQIFGLCGSGRVREGILKIMGKRGDLITKEKISADLAEHIIVGGGLIYQQAIEAAIILGASGIITGGINAKDFKGMVGGSLTTAKAGTDIGIAVLVLEGFGTATIGEDIFELLLKYNNKFVTIDGNRAEVVIPSEDRNCILKIKATHIPVRLEVSEGLMEVSTDTLSVGKKVRVIGPTFFGEQGLVCSVDEKPSTLESGLSSVIITIDTGTRKIRLPYNNLELI